MALGMQVGAMMRLRSVLLVMSVVLATLAAITALSLVVLTGALHRAAAALRESTASIAAAERLESTLVLHARAPAGAFRASLEGTLRSDAAETRRHLSSKREAELVESLHGHLAAYLDSGGQDATFDGAAAGRKFDLVLAAARDLARMNVDQSWELQRNTETWATIGKVIGRSVVALVFAATLLLSIWLRNNLFRPIVAVRAAIERFVGGDRRTRAKEEGPVELREISQRFNELMDKLRNHETRQMVFMAGVVHDLKNPLSTIAVALARLDPARGSLGDDDLVRLISVLKTQVTKMDHLLGDLLDRTQIEAGEFSLKREPHDLAVLVSESVELYRTASPIHPVEVILSTRPRTSCDRIRIGQVLNNLIGNAIKYSPAGGRVLVELREVEGAVEIAVSDQGIGIAREDLARIFEPFCRTAGARHVAQGSGLGLNAAKRIVEAHGGTLDVESSPGRGSTFRVRLPGGTAVSVETSRLAQARRARAPRGIPN